MLLTNCTFVIPLYKLSRAEVPTTKKKQQSTANSGTLHLRDEEDESGNYAEDDQGRKFFCDRIIHFAGVDPNTPQANIKVMC